MKQKCPIERQGEMMCIRYLREILLSKGWEEVDIDSKETEISRPAPQETTCMTYARDTVVHKSLNRNINNQDTEIFYPAPRRDDMQDIFT